jgi:hypothetical protein
MDLLGLRDFFERSCHPDVAAGGVKDLLCLPFHIGAKGRSANAANF